VQAKGMVKAGIDQNTIKAMSNGFLILVAASQTLVI